MHPVAGSSWVEDLLAECVAAWPEPNLRLPVEKWGAEAVAGSWFSSSATGRGMRLARPI